MEYKYSMYINLCNCTWLYIYIKQIKKKQTKTTQIKKKQNFRATYHMQYKLLGTEINIPKKVYRIFNWYIYLSILKMIIK
jgi:uncharacterized ion transporter superfamily protein YfcC